MSEDRQKDGAAALADAIYEKIAAIPASNSGVISCGPTTLRNQLSSRLLRLIAEEAASVADALLSERAKP